MLVLVSRPSDWLQNPYAEWLWFFLQLLGLLTVVIIGVALLWLLVMVAIDITQKRHAIRRNFPVIGRFRYMMEEMGKYLRQYFFALDREEMPFNRAERSWVYRAAKGESTTTPFGSTRLMDERGGMILVSSGFPELDENAEEVDELVIGADGPNPFRTRSLFNISGMSFGALSAPAVRALSQGSAAANAWLNTGEGGLSKYHLEGGGDIIAQIGSGLFGVRTQEGELSEPALMKMAQHAQVRAFEIKLSQGAKPGKGGMLPKEKITKELADIRGIAMGKHCVSPNRHRDAANESELLDFIERIRSVTKKPVGIKFVVSDWGWLRELCAQIKQRGLQSAPDFMTLDSGDGGTGAAPQPLMDYSGMLISESLPLLDNLLREAGLRERVKLIAAGKLIHPAKVAWALASGADAVNCARGFMFALGCIQSMQCHSNTCPTGITTHNPRLQRGLVVERKSLRITRYIEQMHRELHFIARSCGVAQPRLLRRKHIRLMQSDGISQLMSDVFPYPGEGG